MGGRCSAGKPAGTFSNTATAARPWMPGIGPAQPARRDRGHREGQEHVHPRQPVPAKELAENQHQEHGSQSDGQGAEIRRPAAT